MNQSYVKFKMENCIFRKPGLSPALKNLTTNLIKCKVLVLVMPHKAHYYFVKTQLITKTIKYDFKLITIPLTVTSSASVK